MGDTADEARLALTAAVVSSEKRNASAWLALLRYEYGLAKKAATRESWSQLSLLYRAAAAALPPDQRRSEANAAIQVDEARVHWFVGTLLTGTAGIAACCFIGALHAADLWRILFISTFEYAVACVAATWAPLTLGPF